MHVDLAGCNILAAANNHVVSAAGQEEISLVIQVTRIRCWKPAILIMNLGCDRWQWFSDRAWSCVHWLIKLVERGSMVVRV